MGLREALSDFGDYISGRGGYDADTHAQALNRRFGDLKCEREKWEDAKILENITRMIAGEIQKATEGVTNDNEAPNNIESSDVNEYIKQDTLVRVPTNIENRVAHLMRQQNKSVSYQDQYMYIEIESLRDIFAYTQHNIAGWEKYVITSGGDTSLEIDQHSLLFEDQNGERLSFADILNPTYGFPDEGFKYLG